MLEQFFFIEQTTVYITKHVCCWQAARTNDKQVLNRNGTVLPWKAEIRTFLWKKIDLHYCSVSIFAVRRLLRPDFHRFVIVLTTMRIASTCTSINFKGEWWQFSTSPRVKLDKFYKTAQIVSKFFLTNVIPDNYSYLWLFLGLWYHV